MAFCGILLVFLKFSRNNFYPPHLRYVETLMLLLESPSIFFFFFFFFFFCFLPVYWYALSFEYYHQLSARLKKKYEKNEKDESD